MTKKKTAVCMVLFVIVFALMMPSFAKRIYFENANRGIVLSADYNRIISQFKNKEAAELLEEIQKYGINTLTLNITDFDVSEFSALPNKFDLALFIDADKLSKSDLISINNLISRKNVKYINLKGNFPTGTNGEELIKELCGITLANSLVLVVSESKDQSANDIPKKGYNSLKMASGGAIIRCYDTTYSANDKINPDLRFHQMLNSLKDRNTHFINLVPFEDETASLRDNYNAMLSSVSLFTKEAADNGYPFKNFSINYTDYSPHIALNFASSFVFSVLLCYIAWSILFKKMPMSLKILLCVSALGGAAVPFVLLSVAELVYPLVAAVSSSCFLITLIFYTAKKYSHRGFAVCLLVCLAVSLAGFLFSGYFLSALLSGTDYYLYFKTFRGVKLSLIIPVIYSVFAYVKLFGLEKPDFKNCISKKNIVIFVIFLITCAAAGYIYILRSGNSLAFAFETNLRNSIDVLMGIRPRTKEFLIGWPALWLFVWYLSNTKQKLLPFILSVGVAILASSVINSFCHVFTPCLTIYRRTLNGFILSVPIAAVFVFINVLVLKFLKIKK